MVISLLLAFVQLLHGRGRRAFCGRPGQDKTSPDSLTHIFVIVVQVYGPDSPMKKDVVVMVREPHSSRVSRSPGSSSLALQPGPQETEVPIDVGHPCSSHDNSSAFRHGRSGMLEFGSASAPTNPAVSDSTEFADSSAIKAGCSNVSLVFRLRHSGVEFGFDDLNLLRLRPGFGS